MCELEQSFRLNNAKAIEYLESRNLGPIFLDNILNSHPSRLLEEEDLFLLVLELLLRLPQPPDGLHQLPLRRHRQVQRRVHLVVPRLVERGLCCSCDYPDTLSMFYKGQSIWDSRQNFEKNKGQDLALSHIARDIFSRWRLGHDKGR